MQAVIVKMMKMMKLPCVIGKSEGDCVWRGSRRSVGSSFHRQGAAYQKSDYWFSKRTG